MIENMTEPQGTPGAVLTVRRGTRQTGEHGDNNQPSVSVGSACRVNRSWIKNIWKKKEIPESVKK